jgi:hypothetical protein
MASSSTNRKTMLLRQHTGPISSGAPQTAHFARFIGDPRSCPCSHVAQLILSIAIGFSKRASESGQARQHRRRCRRTKPRCRQQPSVFRRLRRSASRLCALQLSQPQPERSANSKSRFIHMSGGYRRNYYTHVCRWTMLRRNHVDPQVAMEHFSEPRCPPPPFKSQHEKHRPRPAPVPMHLSALPPTHGPGARTPQTQSSSHLLQAHSHPLSQPKLLSWPPSSSCTRYPAHET